MGLFGFIGDVASAGIKTVLTPVAVAKDANSDIQPTVASEANIAAEKNISEDKNNFAISVKFFIYYILNKLGNTKLVYSGIFTLGSKIDLNFLVISSKEKFVSFSSFSDLDFSNIES